MTAGVDHEEGSFHLKCDDCLHEAVKVRFVAEEMFGQRFLVAEVAPESSGAYITGNNAYCPSCAAVYHRGLRDHERMVVLG